MDIVLAMAIFFVIVTMIFVCIAVFLPEWMGITGKKAKKIIEEQQKSPEHPSENEPKNNTDSQDSH